MSVTLAPGSPMALQTAATSGTGGILVLSGQCTQWTFSLIGSGTISGGTILLEEAPYYDLDDEPVASVTWSLLPGGTITASNLTGGVSQLAHYRGSSWAVRARISSAITGGGTVTIRAWGN